MDAPAPDTAQLLRIDPAVPVVWRDPQTLQFGVGRERLRLSPVSEEAERAVSLLFAGVHPAVLAASVPEPALDPLLELLDDVIERPRQQGVPVEVFGETAFATRFAAAVTGLELTAPLAVLVADWVLPAAAANRWLNRDQRHLPILVSDGVLEAGPLVVPGAGPCLHCDRRRRCEDDPQWPAIAAQLVRRAGPVLGPVDCATALAAAVRWVRAADDAAPGSSWRLDLISGREETVLRQRHPDCRCAARQESDWGDDSGRAPS